MSGHRLMVEIRRTRDFTDWIDGLRDERARAVIGRRINRMARGVMGDVKPVGSGVSEARIDHGPGYRFYFIQRGAEVVILLCGGDKSSQKRDILRARDLAETT